MRYQPFIGILRRPAVPSKRFHNIRGFSATVMSQQQEKKTYHLQATGLAGKTCKEHSAEKDLKLFGLCFCPFVQRVWITLELKGIPYQYIEIDAYKKPKELLDVNPRGLVPALRHGDWGCYESTVLLDYLEDISPNHPLLPGDAKLRAHSRLWGDHVNRHIVPTFYKLLVDQNKEARPEHEKNLKQQFELLVKEASKDGPFFLDEKPTWVDVQIAPWILRLKLVLKPYRNWPDPENLQLGNGLTERWTQWVHAIEEDEAIKRTTSDTVLYLESYERYAENRPNTSKLADAINSGSALP